MPKHQRPSGPNLSSRQQLTAPTNSAHVPVSVNGDVYVPVDKPYTLRLNIEVMNRLTAYCQAHDRGKGPFIAEAVTRLLDELEAAHD